MLISIAFATSIFAQDSEYRFIVTDLNNEFIYFHTLVIDDSTYVIMQMNDNRSDVQQVYSVNLSEGIHKITAIIEGTKMIDTLINFSPSIQRIYLNVNMKTDFHLREFKKGFDKIYINTYDLILGLNKDGTFLLRSFFHVSIIGCFQYESGRYIIENNKLILDVNDYKSECFNPSQKIRHRYEYTIENDSIIDLNKYYGFIEKAYFGVNH